MTEEKRPEWMSSISGIVNPDDYLLGRKIDKTFELYQQEKADKAREQRTNLIASNQIKLEGDPILDLERRKHELKLEIINNPIRLKRLREEILRREREERQYGLKSPSSDKTREIRTMESNQPSSTKRSTRDIGSRSRERHRSSTSSESSSSPSDSRSRKPSRHSHSRRHRSEKQESSSRRSHNRHHKHHHRSDEFSRSVSSKGRHRRSPERRGSHYTQKHSGNSARSPRYDRRDREKK